MGCRVDFIANDGSYAHRGVWHITDNLTVKEIPAFAERRPSYNPDSTFLYEREASIEYTGDAICGQKDGMIVGGNFWVHWTKLKDGTRHCLVRAKRPDVVFGLDGYIPGPLCSRCAKKAGIEF
jgi:hypothetical protein